VTAAALDRASWQGDDVSVATVVQALERLEAEHYSHPHGHATTHTLNLVVGPAAAREEIEVEELLGSVRARHPSRTILLAEHPLDRIDAAVAIDCELAGPGAALCHDRVMLVADSRRLERVGSLVRPLLARGLQTVVWLPGPEAHAPLERALAGVGDAVVVDSAASPEVRSGLARSARLAEHARVCDLAWGRIDRWRARIAAAFDEPGRLEALECSRSLEIDQRGAATDAVLLCGWVAARAGWRIERLAATEDGALAGRAARPAADPVELAISPVAGRGWTCVERVAFAGAVEVERGPLLQLAGDELLDALAARDGYTRGYADALGALEGAAGMEPPA
jgi:glucose-6-phosphate dehydrogenase assembly protein OpcA